MKMNNQFIGMEHYLGHTKPGAWLWYDNDTEKWRFLQDCDGYSSNMVGIHSFKAARRHLRKHDEIPKGTKFRLASRFVGYDRILVKK